MDLICFGIVKHQEIFNSVDECVEYLEKLDKGKIKLDERWIVYKNNFI